METAMHWTADGERMREQLMRIVALLFALGSLADRASRAPLPMRVSAMGFLRPAEAVAWDFIAGQIALPEPIGAGDDPAAAMRLAARFRALAIALAALSGRFGGCGRAHVVGLPTAGETAGNLGERSRERLQPFDTS
jgi:hypothetical protein